MKKSARNHSWRNLRRAGALVMLAGLALGGCATVAEQTAQKIDYILPVQQAGPGEVVPLSLRVPAAVKSCRAFFLQRWFRFYSRRDMPASIRTVFLPIPPETPPGDTPIVCSLEVTGVRRPISETVMLQVLPDLNSPETQNVRAKGFDPQAYAREYGRLRERLEKSDYRAERLENFLLPQGGRIRTVYGTRRIYNGKQPVQIYGLEIEPLSTGNNDVVAAGNGRVLLAEKLAMLGNTVLIDHGFSYATLYAHLKTLEVKPGQEIKRGETLGRVGATGAAAPGTRLLYQLLVAGIPVDVQKNMDINLFK